MDFLGLQGGVAGVSNGMLFACGTISSCRGWGRRGYAPGKARGGAIASYGNDEQRRQTEKDAI